MQRSEILKGRTLALDASSLREKDKDGYLHVAKSNLTREQVAAYYGSEIPNGEKLGFKPDEIYYGLRPAEELKKAVETFNGVPLLIRHKMDSADDPNKELRVGTIGTDAKWESPFITNSLVVWDSDAIRQIEDGSLKDLSCGYWYEVDMTEGDTPDGRHYDFVMRSIKCNHVALVNIGRVPDCYVADENFPEVKHMEEEKKACDDFTEFARKTIQGSGVELSPEDVDKLVRAFAQANADKDKDAAEEAEKDVEGTRDEAPDDVPPADEEGGDVPAQDADEDEDEVPPVEKAEKPEEDDDDEYAKDAENKISFAEGVKYGESREKDDPKKLDSEHESEGEKKAIGAQDADEIVRRVTESVEKRVASKFIAAEKTRPVIGTVNPMAFDSAEKIYLRALKKLGINVSGIAPSAAESAFTAAFTVRTASAMDSATAKPDAITKLLDNIQNKF